MRAILMRSLRTPGRVPARLRGFVRDEDGSMIVFGMFLVVMMLIVGGMAVDIMRSEATRTRLQSTLDRAVLAAADLDQSRDCQTVVRDYFRAGGLLPQLNSVTCTQNFNSRTVGATARLDMSTYFLDMVGVDSLATPASGTAAEAVNDIEIILVLDISGSMLANSKLVNLQTAARDFVQTVLQNDAQHRISIGIVPFNGQVNLGPLPTGSSPTLASWYTGITDRVPTLYGATYSYLGCVDLPTSVYSTQTISRSLAMPSTALADTFTSTQLSNAYYHYTGTWSGSTSYGTPQAANLWCPAKDGNTGSAASTAGNVVRMPSNSISTLQGQINGLKGVGATSINAGMRWGMTLLDPASQSMFTALGVPFTGRPFAYQQQNTLKIIVLMTDGENFPEERVNAGFREATPLSPIWRAPDGYYSIFHASKVNRTGTGSTLATNIAASRPFWVPHLAQWQSRPWIGVSPNTGNPFIDAPARIASNTNYRLDTNGDFACTNAEDGRGTFNNSTQACWPTYAAQSWPQVWTSVRLSWVAWQLYGRAMVTSAGTTGANQTAVFNAQMDLMRTKTDSASGNTPIMDAQLGQMCTRAKNSGIIVYGIAFEAPTGGQTAIYNCSSSPSHYYNAQGLQISTAFRAIAAQINALRLIN